MERRSETFGRLFKAGMAGIAHLEGKTQRAIEEELGAAVGVAGVTLQRYKAGYLPPTLETIEQFARVCVRRGLFGPVWLERFLDAARCPRFEARAMLAELFPEAPVSNRAAVMRPNLPPPTYAHFIMRQEPYDALLAGLRSDLPVTMLVSLGGMGKTSLARAVAGDCLTASNATVRFNTVVWVSDKDRPGATNLSTTLDEIAWVLDFPGLLALPFLDRQREVDGLLRRHAVLLVVDNADTITDRALLDWLMCVPAPSKALVISRFAIPALENSYRVELGPLTRAESGALIAEWLRRNRLRTMPNAAEDLLPIAHATGGNPKAIEVALSLLQYQGRDAVIDEIHAAPDELFEELLAQAWNLLDDHARRVLSALPCFPTSASAEALAFCADIPQATFRRSAARLASLALLDVEQHDIQAAPRYNAHSLVRIYAQARQSKLAPSEQHLVRERWLMWCVELASSVGFCWGDLDQLATLDDDYEIIQAAIDWAVSETRDTAVLALIEGIRYYYNVRGFWGEEQLRNYEYYAAAARRLGSIDHEVLALARYIQVLSKQGRIELATALATHLGQLGTQHEAIAHGALEPPNDMLVCDAAFEYGHALALLARAHGNMENAEAHWHDLLGLSRQLGGQYYVVNRRWLATALLAQGQTQAAKELYTQSLDDARLINDVRSISGNTLKLAVIAFAEGDSTAAAEAQGECLAIALRFRDRRRIAECHRLAAGIAQHQGDPLQAKCELHAALDLFERLGMGNEASEAQHALSAMQQH